MLNNSLFTYLRDGFFDLPNAHRLKNGLKYFITESDSVSFDPQLERTHRNFYIISKNPIIVYTTENINDIQLFSKIIGENKLAYFIISFWWTLFDGPNNIKHIQKSYRLHQQKYPKHKIIFLFNNMDEYKLFRKKRIPCEYIHQNAMVDFEIFKPLELIKKYDIVYNGRLEEMKRHYLLRECSNIGLISGYVHKIDEKKIRYIERLKANIPEAEILNYDLPLQLKEFSLNLELPLLGPEEVCQRINRAKVGVILSAREGACYASMEYLLSGIPVVSTINIGGRDVFFDNRYCRIVRSDPTAIKNAVYDLIKKDLTPTFIRNETFKKVTPHILNMKNLISKLMFKGNEKKDFDGYWDKIYINKLSRYSQPFPGSFISMLKNTLI